MKSRNVKIILESLIKVVYYESDFIKKNTECSLIADETFNHIRSIPWYVRLACHYFFYAMEFCYPFYALEFSRFSRSPNLDKQKKYMRHWSHNPLLLNRITYRLIFAILGQITAGRPPIAKHLGYDKDLIQKSDYDKFHCHPR